MTSRKVDYYNILGVLRKASQEEIKRAYYEAAQRYHPDKNVAVGETEVFLAIQQAYEVLSNPKRRARYDATLPAEIESHPLLGHEIFFSRPGLVRITEPQLIYALLVVQPRLDAEKIPAPPLNVCLLLDRSTSMQGEKMDMVKAAAIQFIRSLRAQDKFSIVTFSDKAEVLIQSAFQKEATRQEAQIQMLQVSGATEIHRGLSAGLEEIRKNRDALRINHLILLTDGHTYGDEQVCLGLAAQAARESIGITGMGIGNEWNDIFLDALASHTGGTSAYISDPKDIQRHLIDKFKALASVYADEITLDIKKQDGVLIKYIFRILPEGGPVSLEEPLKLGPILQDGSLQVLFEFMIHPAALDAENVVLLDGNLKASIPAHPKPVPPLELQFSRPVQQAAEVVPPSPKIMQAMSNLMLYRLQERAQAEAQAGHYARAARHLQNLATHLLAQGEHQLAKTALIEAEQLEHRQAWSATAQKELKYNTRALLLSGTREKVL